MILKHVLRLCCLAVIPASPALSAVMVTDQQDETIYMTNQNPATWQVISDYKHPEASAGTLIGVANGRLWTNTGKSGKENRILETDLVSGETKVEHYLRAPSSESAFTACQNYDQQVVNFYQMAINKKGYLEVKDYDSSQLMATTPIKATAIHQALCGNFDGDLKPDLMLLTENEKGKTGLIFIPQLMFSDKSNGYIWIIGETAKQR